MAIAVWTNLQTHLPSPRRCLMILPSQRLERQRDGSGPASAGPDIAPSAFTRIVIQLQALKPVTSGAFVHLLPATLDYHIIIGTVTLGFAYEVDRLFSDEMRAKL